MRILLPLIISMTFLSACSNDSTSSPAGDTSQASKADSTQVERNDVAGCYIRTIGRDTLIVQLDQQGSYVTGSIYFDNYQKDGSSGSAAGTIREDTIHLYYDFQSEGTSSVMEMFFLKKDGQLIRGLGDIGVKGDTAYFTSPLVLTYPENEALNKIECDQLHEKYRKEK